MRKDDNSRNPFKELIDDCIQGILIHRNENPIYVNAAWAEMHGYAVADVLQMSSIAPLIADTDRNRLDAYRKLREYGGNAPGAYEYRAVKKDGAMIWVENRVRSIMWNGLPAIQMTAFEITDKKKTEQSLENARGALKKGKERMEKILHAMPSGVLIVQADTHRIVDVNPQAAAMIGAPVEKIVGKECHRFVCPKQRGKCPITDQKKNVELAETELLTVDGRIVPILKTVTPVIIDGSRWLIESFVDLSDRKKAEATRAEDEKLRGALELAGAVCHELNQPLMSITGYTELLLQDVAPDTEAAEFLQRISDQVARMGNMTRNLMNITRYQTKAYLNTRIIDIDKAGTGDR